MDSDIFHLKHYDYEIPSELIAQEPASPRDSSCLLVANRADSSLKEKSFKDIIEFLKSGDVLVLNNTEVIRARLLGKNSKGQTVEVLLLREKSQGVWEVLVKPGKRAGVDEVLIFHEEKFQAKIIGKNISGSRIIEFNIANIDNILLEVGKVPLPPYIKREVKTPDDYQTVYAKKKGAVAAPTAGLHFTKKLLGAIEKKGVKIVYVTLHCGLPTFRPVKTEDIRQHVIGSEWIEIPELSAQIINRAKKDNRRVIGVGTTAIRTLESAAFLDEQGVFQVTPFQGETSLFIVSGYKFKIIDAVVTNFHTPCSTNLILMASFMGLNFMKESYFFAKQQKFRFFSFGDAMLIT
jgi:S-adenosylmethionine:tRNA ribosyltransferase-isomerase